MLYKESGLLGVSGISRTCAPCSPATSRKPRKRSISSATASSANSARWPPRPAASMRWCSPAASANTPPRSAAASACSPNGWASASIRKYPRKFPAEISGVLIEKYAKGKETNVHDVRRRVAYALAQVEQEKDRAHWEAKFLWAQENGFIPAGRINSAAGTDLQPR
jgi:hypothetical protein